MYNIFDLIFSIVSILILNSLLFTKTKLAKLKKNLKIYFLNALSKYPIGLALDLTMTGIPRILDKKIAKRLNKWLTKKLD